MEQTLERTASDCHDAATLEPCNDVDDGACGLERDSTVDCYGNGIYAKWVNSGMMRSTINMKGDGKRSGREVEEERGEK